MTANESLSQQRNSGSRRSIHQSIGIHLSTDKQMVCFLSFSTPDFHRLDELTSCGTIYGNTLGKMKQHPERESKRFAPDLKSKFPYS